MPATTPVTVVRPYTPRIREKMFGTLSEAGLSIDPDHVIPPGTPDDEVVRQVGNRIGHVLLVPFHAHRDSEGKELNGLDVAALIHERCPALNRSRILMPVSKFGMAAATLRLEKTPGEGGLPPELRDRILLIQEDDLGDPGLQGRIRQHISA